MRKGDYSIPALVMGVILGQIGEDTFSRSMVLLDYNVLAFFTEPISAVLVSAGLLTIAMNIIRHRELFGSYYAKYEDENA